MGADHPDLLGGGGGLGEVAVEARGARPCLFPDVRGQGRVDLRGAIGVRKDVVVNEISQGFGRETGLPDVIGEIDVPGRADNIEILAPYGRKGVHVEREDNGLEFAGVLAQVIVEFVVPFDVAFAELGEVGGVAQQPGLDTEQGVRVTEEGDVISALVRRETLLLLQIGVPWGNKSIVGLPETRVDRHEYRQKRGSLYYGAHLVH